MDTSTPQKSPIAAPPSSTEPPYIAIGMLLLIAVAAYVAFNAPHWLATKVMLQTVTAVVPHYLTAYDQSQPHFGGGTRIVSTTASSDSQDSIPPGTYRTRDSSNSCTYARLSKLSDANKSLPDRRYSNTPEIITIASTDAAFTSEHCGIWTTDLSSITVDKTAINDGTFITGVDFEPGTYTADARPDCYYARLKGFGGTVDDIIDNRSTASAATVTIKASDRGFVSERCGVWEKAK